MYKAKKGIAPIIAIIIVLLALGGGGAYYALKRQMDGGKTLPDKKETEHDKMTNDEMMKHENAARDEMMKKGEGMMDAGMTGPKTHKIEMTQSGFSPKEITIKKGDKVEFVNKDSAKHWPASGIHPTHKLCPGFDAVGGVGAGKTYSFTFNEVKECPFHDHLSPNLFGQIIVE